MTAQEKLWKAAMTGDKATIRALVFEDIDFDARDEEGRTAFNIATQFGQTDTAQTILAARQMRFVQNLNTAAKEEKAATENTAEAA